jgi:gluconokinase
MRVGARKEHYMPASLVDSQFAALEPPDEEPDVVTLSADCNLVQSMSDLVLRLRERMRQ